MIASLHPASQPSTPFSRREIASSGRPAPSLLSAAPDTTRFGRTAQTKTPLAAKRGAISQTAQWFKRQRARLGQKFENVAVWAKDVIAQAIICLAAILSCGSYVPAWAKNYIHHKFFFAPHKVSGLALVKDDWLRQNIQEISFCPALDHIGKSSVRLAAWHIPAQKDKPTVVFSHGRNCNVSQQQHLMKALGKAGYGVFVYDYPGFGDSEGKPSEEGLYESGLAASRFMKNVLKVDYGKQVIMGHSLGGAVAVDVAHTLSQRSGQTPRGLFVINTFNELKAPFAARKKASNAAVRRLFNEDQIGLEFNSERKIKQVQAPVLVMHAEGDEAIPFELGETLARSARLSSHRKQSAEFKPFSHPYRHMLNQAMCAEVVTQLNHWLARNPAPLGA